MAGFLSECLAGFLGIRTLSIVCESCGRRGRYAVARLIDEHGDAKLTDLLLTLADC